MGVALKEVALRRRIREGLCRLPPNFGVTGTPFFSTFHYTPLCHFYHVTFPPSFSHFYPSPSQACFSSASRHFRAASFLQECGVKPTPTSGVCFEVGKKINGFQAGGTFLIPPSKLAGGHQHSWFSGRSYHLCAV